LRRLSNGRIVSEPVDGEEVSIAYGIVDGASGAVARHGWSDQIDAVDVRGGRSIVFSVAGSALQGGRAVEVAFRYEWERSLPLGSSVVKHRLRISADDVPTEVAVRLKLKQGARPAGSWAQRRSRRVRAMHPDGTGRRGTTRKDGGVLSTTSNSTPLPRPWPALMSNAAAASSEP
jgi:hypothetical protein